MDFERNIKETSLSLSYYSTTIHNLVIFTFQTLEWMTILFVLKSEEHHRVGSLTYAYNNKPTKEMELYAESQHTLYTKEKRAGV